MSIASTQTPCGILCFQIDIKAKISSSQPFVDGFWHLKRLFHLIFGAEFISGICFTIGGCFVFVQTTSHKRGWRGCLWLPFLHPLLTKQEEQTQKWYSCALWKFFNYFSQTTLRNLKLCKIVRNKPKSFGYYWEDKIYTILFNILLILASWSICA